MQVHDPAPCFSLQIALAPQGEGLQGRYISIGWSKQITQKHTKQDSIKLAAEMMKY
jgi:hypothetical protein